MRSRSALIRGIQQLLGRENADPRVAQGLFVIPALGDLAFVWLHGGSRPEDGYVIGMGNFAPLAVNPTMFEHMSFDPAKDLTPICLIEKGPLILMVKPDFDFEKWARG